MFGFSLSVAALEIEHFLRMVVPHPGHANIGAQTAHFVRGVVDNDLRACDSHCPFCAMTAKGARTGLTGITGRHHASELARSRRTQTSRTGRLLTGIRKLWSQISST